MTETEPRMPAQAESSEPAQPHDVFVSYSRADREAVVELVGGLDARGLKAWVDLKDIPPSAEWMAEIRVAIEASDGYLVVVSPSLAGSEVCAEELGLAREAGKRIVPVMVRPTDPASVPGALAALNWIDATDGALEAASDRAVEALQTDLAHVRAHTKLGVRAVEWERKDDTKALLLRGAEIAEAEAVVASGSDPRATPAQARYVQASRSATTRRQRGAIGAVAAALVVSLALSAFALVQRGEAREQAAQSRSRELAASAMGQLDIDPERSLALATEAMASARTAEAVDALRRSLETSRVRRTLRGHEASVISVRYSPDGGQILTGSTDGTARIWATANSRAAIVLSGHDDIIESVDYSADGLWAVTASFDGTAIVWDADSGDEVCTLRHGGGAVHDATFDATGALVATAGSDGIARTWDPSTCRLMTVFRGHTRPIYDVDIDPRSTTIVTASDDNTARLWDAKSGRTLSVLEGHVDGLYSASYSPDGSLIATASEDGTAKIWSGGSGRLMTDLDPGAAPIVEAAFSPDGRSVVTAGEDETARVWDARSGRQLAVLRGHQGEIETASFSDDGNLVVTSSLDGTARVWDADDGTSIATLRGHAGEVLDARFSSDGASVLSGSQDGTARIWDVSTGRTVVKGEISFASADPTGPRIAVSTWDGVAYLIDSDTGRETMRLDAGAPLTTASLSADGRFLVSGGLDGIGRVWDVASGKLVAELRGHDETYMAADFFASSDRVLTWSDDGTARLWDARTGEQLGTYRHGEPNEFGGVWEAHVSENGLVFTSGVGDGTVRMWDAGSGEELWHDDRLFRSGGVGLALSTDGRFAGTVASTAIVWHAESGRRIADLDDGGEILGMVFSPDGELVATRSDDGVARVWDPETGGLLQRLPDHDGVVNSVWWDPDGQRLATTDDDGITRVWNPNSGDLLASFGGGGGPGGFAFFSGDGTRVVSTNETSVRIDRCDACGSIGELISLARRRLVDTLGAEGSSLRGSIEGARSDPIVLVNADGERVSDGVVTPGTYTLEHADPEFSFELEDDWFVTAELAPEEGDVGFGTLIQLQPIGDPFSGLSFISLDPGRVLDPFKEWDERRNLLPFPDSLPRWLARHPNLETTSPLPTSVGGINGVSADTEVAFVPRDNPWPTCGGCVTLLALSARHETGPLTTDDLVNALGPDEVDRWIVLETGGRIIVVNAFSADRRSFERFMPAADRVLATMVIAGSDE